MKTTHVLMVSVLVFVVGLVTGLQLNSSTDKQPEPGSSADRTQLLDPAPELPAPLVQPLAQAPVVDATEVEQLQLKVRDLEQQLSAQDQMLELAQQSLQQGLASETKDPEQNTDAAGTAISPEQASSFLPEPFASLMAKQAGQAIDYLNQHQVEEIDSEWAYQMELKIADHFATHEHASQVNLSSVSCKTSICEIRGYEYEPERFIVVYNAMQTQNWWRYSSSYAFQDSNEQGRYFYLLAELKR
ncbi:hypothetical protein Rhein_0736 [Rheinheimera sp. A13L]|uniref:hypothetical protein n=1 Tax=Rheinheimera sp. A13L TaxID=506534 RepID=UPI000212539A|nr:hypothetical protein [Rheinheimera sp. A13L]EGM79118.1 hypothetical protein Rhein_0736 [Rheinheimera sp. A13L]